MMARSVRRNGTALSRRWKLGGEDTGMHEEKEERKEGRRGERLSSFFF